MNCSPNCPVHGINIKKCNCCENGIPEKSGWHIVASIDNPEQLIYLRCTKGYFTESTAQLDWDDYLRV